MGQTNIPSKQLLTKVRARFVEHGGSLHGWCVAEDVDWSYACGSLTGRHKFPAAKRLRKRILRAAGLTTTSDQETA